MTRKIIVVALVSALSLVFATAAFGHVLDRKTAEKYATQYGQAIVEDNEDGIYDFDLGRCRAVSVHRRDCTMTFYYADEHAEGACDATVTVRFYTPNSHRIKVYDRGDWDCDAED
jgi:hypothetical protein